MSKTCRLLIGAGIEVALNRHVAGGGAPATTASLSKRSTSPTPSSSCCLGSRSPPRAGSPPTRPVPRWLRGLGYALLPILVIGGLAFIIDSAVLTMVLDASLLLLLVWAAAVSVVSARRAQGAHITAVADR